MSVVRVTLSLLPEPLIKIKTSNYLLIIFIPIVPKSCFYYENGIFSILPILVFFFLDYYIDILSVAQPALATTETEEEKGGFI